MYLGANQYPEFSGKDKKYIKACLKFCCSKANMGSRSWFVVAILIVLSALWGLWIEDLVLGIYAEAYGFLFPISIGIFFGLYLLYEININMHKAVKKYIKEFDNNNL